MIDRDFGNWLAGFIDGEGCFSIVTIKNRPLGFRPVFSLCVRADDDAIVLKAAAVTGLGSTHYYVAQSGNRVIRWVVQSRADCQGLTQLLTKFPLRAKKRRDFEIWQKAVLLHALVQLGRGKDNSRIKEQLWTLKVQLTAVRTEGLHA